MNHSKADLILGRVLAGVLGGALLGGAASVLPVIELVVPGAIALMVVAVAFRRRVRAYLVLPGSFSGVLLGAMAGVTLMVLAYRAPYKYLHQIVGPFPAPIAPPELCERLKQQGVYLAFDLYGPQGQRQRPSFSLLLPARSISLRELIAEVERQSGLQHHVGYCANGVSLIQGAAPIGGISFRPRYEYLPPQAKPLGPG